MERFQNKYRIQSHRKPQWDYSGNGIYFITLVTQNRECHLGQIVADTHGRAYLQQSDFGKIVNEEWLKSFEIRDELFLDEYIIMPNHLHPNHLHPNHPIPNRHFPNHHSSGNQNQYRHLSVDSNRQ